jgi:hypothetical protein
VFALSRRREPVRARIRTGDGNIQSVLGRIRETATLPPMDDVEMLINKQIKTPPDSLPN